MIALLLRMQSQITTLCPLILFIVSNYDFRLLECVPADHGLDSTTLEKLRNGRGRFQKESSYRYKSIIVTSNLCHSFHRSLNRQAMSSRMCIAECSATHTHTHTHDFCHKPLTVFFRQQQARADASSSKYITPLHEDRCGIPCYSQLR